MLTLSPKKGLVNNFITKGSTVCDSRSNDRARIRVLIRALYLLSCRQAPASEEVAEPVKKVHLEFWKKFSIKRNFLTPRLLTADPSFQKTKKQTTMPFGKYITKIFHPAIPKPKVQTNLSFQSCNRQANPAGPNSQQAPVQPAPMKASVQPNQSSDSSSSSSASDSSSEEQTVELLTNSFCRLEFSSDRWFALIGFCPCTGGGAGKGARSSKKDRR